jgi:hypothetical protein
MLPGPDAKRVAFRGRIGEEAYVRAQDLAARSSGRKGTPISTLCLVAGAFFLLLALAASGDGALSWLVLSGLALGAAWLLRDRTRELWRQDPVLQALQSGWIDDGGLLLQSQGSESRISWEAYSGYAQEGDLLVLFQGPLRYLPFSRDLFPEASDWDDFLALVDSHLYRAGFSSPKAKSLLTGKPFWITILIAFLLSVAFALWNGLWNT